MPLPLVPEDKVSIEFLQEVFRSAEYEASVDETGDLVVHSGEDEWTVVLEVDNDRHFVVFRCFARFREDAQHPDRLELVNRLNDQVVLARFSAAEHDLLVADYHLSFEEGISVYQLLRSFRWFLQASRDGVAAHDEADLVL